MQPWQSGFVETNGIRAHYTRTGGDKPPFVLAHGFSDDGLCWTAVADALCSDYDVIMPDARAHGHSSAPKKGYGQVNQAKDLFGIIQSLELKQPIVLGHSMGAVTTLLLACLYPGIPGAVVLEDPPAFWMTREETPDEGKLDNGLKTWALQLRNHSREDLIAQAQDENPAWAEVEFGPWADSKLLFNPVMVDNFFDEHNFSSINWDQILPQAVCPMLVISADPELGSILTPADIDVLKKAIPHLQKKHLANAGHSIHRDQFKAYLRTVKSFLAKAV